MHTSSLTLTARWSTPKTVSWRLLPVIRLDDASLTLAQALAGSGLEAEEAELLESLMTERRFAKGEIVFRSGDPGDSMFVLLQGQIGIWLPEAHIEGDAPRGRRLISFAPGVVFGDMGLLAGPRARPTRSWKAMRSFWNSSVSNMSSW